MKIIIISEENHGEIGVATTMKAAFQFLIEHGWLTTKYDLYDEATGAWDGLKQWLENLGFVVDSNLRNSMATIKWDDISTIKIVMMTEPKPATTKIITNPLGWEYLSLVDVFHCPHCSGYNKTPTPYCPNCGTKMKEEG